jgi:hypothetical protein
VAVSADTVVVGATGEASSATVINGNQSNNSAPESGAAYIFATGAAAGSRLTIVPDGTGGYFLRFSGTPGLTYRVERAPSVTGAWNTVSTQVAPVSGLIEYHETAPPAGRAFYRVAQP